MTKHETFLMGVRAGIPIGLGYLSISFTFGIMAVSYGLYWWQAVLISMLCVTSAGQLAGITVMLSPAHYIEMLISQITINIRYSFMSISLSQKVDSSIRGIFRWLLSFMITDEIFAVAITQKEVSRSFFLGLMTIPYLGWTLGTLSGSLLGSVLPDSLMSAMNIAIYGMFVAIIVPEMKKSRPIVFVVALSSIMSILFTYVPIFKKIPAGLSVSICAIGSALFATLFFPMDDTGEAENL